MTTIGSGATPVDGGTAQAATAEVGHDTGRTAAPPLAPEQVYGTEPLLKRLGGAGRRRPVRRKVRESVRYAARR
jgi:hypothetical protein